MRLDLSISFQRWDFHLHPLIIYIICWMIFLSYRRSGLYYNVYYSNLLEEKRSCSSEEQKKDKQKRHSRIERKHKLRKSWSH